MLRTGVDLVEIPRFQAVLLRHGERFLRRIFTSQERRDTRENLASLAARFAAKEAAAKVLGCGIGVVGWQEIEILRGSNGEPLLLLSGHAAELAQEMHLQEWALSLSHTAKTAVAVVVATSR